MLHQKIVRTYYVNSAFSILVNKTKKPFHSQRMKRLFLGLGLVYKPNLAFTKGRISIPDL